MGEVGRSVPRIDAEGKVTGRTAYVDDLDFAGSLHGAVARSPRPHVRLPDVPRRIALEVPGVVAVLTAADIPGRNRVPVVFDDAPALAAEGDACRFAGEGFALVAATSRKAALAAAHRLEEWLRTHGKALPALLDPRAAMGPDAARVNPNLAVAEAEALGRRNVLSYHRVRKGDVEAGFRDSDVVVEGEYRTSWQEHAYIEPQGMIAVPDADGGVTVHGSMQCPFYIQKALHSVLGQPMARCRVVQAATGGGFGGKEDAPSFPAVHAALLARATLRPVRLVLSREDDIVSMTKRHPGIIRIRYGAKRDGTLVACAVDYVLNAGAWSTLSPVVLWRGTMHATGPYRIPHVKVDAFAVATHTVPNGAYRGFGQPQVQFANESLVDELAERLGMDPMELRRKNALRLGDPTPTGHVLKESVGFSDVLYAAARESDWLRRKNAASPRVYDEPSRGPSGRIPRGERLYGIGCSALHYGVGLGAAGKRIDRAGAFLQVDADGSVQIAVGTTEMGQGHNTVLAQIAAEELGTATERVTVLPIDTSRVPDSGPTVASRSTVMSGGAVRDAARKVRAAIHEGIGRRWNLPAEALGVETGWVFAKTDPARRVSFEEAVLWAAEDRAHLAAQGFFLAPDSTWDAKTGLGDAYYVYSWSANVAEVAVDVRTGEVEVLRFVSVHDIGRAVNPQQAEGQIQGGVVQGIGYALYEDLVAKDGVFERPNFSGFIIPTALDVPPITPIIVEHPYAAGPFGAKGLGEPPLIGAAPAIANAIRDAVGVRLREIPMTPERVLRAIEERRAAAAPAPRPAGTAA